MPKFTNTRSETLLEMVDWYGNQTNIQRAAQMLEDNHDIGEIHFGPVTEACKTGDCRACKGAFGALIECAARQLRRDSSATMFDVLRSAPFRKMLDRVQSVNIGSSAIYQNEDQTLKLGCISEIAEMSVVGSHVAHGLRTYEVTEGLLDRLKLTGLHGIPDEEVRLPFASTYFQFPRGMLRLHAVTNKLVDVTGALMREFQKVYGSLGSEPKRMVELSLFGKRTFEEDASEFMVFTIELPLGVAWENRMGSIIKLDASGDSKGDFSPFHSFMPAFWDLLVNIILYATWPEAGQREEVVHNPEAVRLLEQIKKHQKGTHKHERAKEALRRIPQLRRILLGRTVQPLPAPPTDGNPLAVRTLVQGHWMRVAIGPGKPNERKERKWIFREPFWRGPEGSPEGSHRHRLT